jgi:hypothetical protein
LKEFDMKRYKLLFIVLFAAATLSLHAQLQAVVKEATGKVEVKLPGKDWAPAKANMVLAQGTLISTGFNSRLLLDIGQSRLTVNPLTRLSLDEIVKRESVNSTSLALKVGKVSASVKSAPGERSSFTVKGPVSTAAVRGTEFSYDGYTLAVSEGTVTFSNLMGQEAQVGAGDGGTTDGYTPPQTGESLTSDLVAVTPAEAGGLLSDGGAGAGGGGAPSLPVGTISITIQ